METIQLPENDLKRCKRAGLFIDARTLKCLNVHIGTTLISFKFYFYFKNMPIL